MFQSPDAGLPESFEPTETAPTSTVIRPEPGTLARGVWEAPAWAFYVAGAVVVVAALLYVAARAGLLRRRPK